MSALLGQIAVVQRELDALDTQLGTAITAIEHALRARVNTRIEVAVTGERFIALAFGKHSGAWQFLVAYDNDFHPLAGAARDVRARALAGGHIERLITGAAEQIRTQLDGRKAATEAANAVLHILNHQGA